MLEDFNFDHQPALNRDMITHLRTGGLGLHVTHPARSILAQRCDHGGPIAPAPARVYSRAVFDRSTGL